MNVHESITKHIQSKEKAIRQFEHLDRLREEEIDRVIRLCKENKPFSTESINQITREIKELGKRNMLDFPDRKMVDETMVKEYVNLRLQKERQQS